MHQIYINLGSNFDKQKNIKSALFLLNQKFGKICCSSLYQSAAVDGTREDYFNMVVGLTTELSVASLQQYLRQIEEKLGRDRSQAERVSIDLDLLLCDDLIGTVDGVELPHPDIEKYLHVLQPLAELEPKKCHPVSGRNYQSLLERFPKRLAVVEVDS